MVKVDSDGGGVQERRQKSTIFVSGLPLDIGFYFHSGYMVKKTSGGNKYSVSQK